MRAARVVHDVRVTLRINRAAKIAAVSGLILATTTGCWGSPEPGQGPNADANGLFPRTYSEQGFIDSAGHLLTATAATARTRSYTFDVDVPKDQAFSLVANCTSGHVSISGVRAPAWEDQEVCWATALAGTSMSRCTSLEHSPTSGGWRLTEQVPARPGRASCHPQDQVAVDPAVIRWFGRQATHSCLMTSTEISTAGTVPLFSSQ